MTTIIVLAKSPVPGRVKTRLCPPLVPEQAAAIAEAALIDTLRVAENTSAHHRYLVVDGTPGAWLPKDVFRVLPQRSGGLAERLIDAFHDVFADLMTRGDLSENAEEPCILIAMDTPQITAELLDNAITQLSNDQYGSAFGPAADGGYWLIGLKRPDSRVFEDIPMSVDETGAIQLARLTSLGHEPAVLAMVRDIDEFDDLDYVADTFPDLRVSGVWRTLRHRVTRREA